MIFKRHNLNGIDYGCEPKTYLKGDFPDVLKVAKVDVECRQNKSDSRSDQVHFNQVNQKEERFVAGYYSAESKENKEDDHV